MKQRRQFLKRLGGLTALLALASPGRAQMRKTQELEGNFAHVVFFWLIDEKKETQEKFTSELTKFIDNVDLILTKHIGTPADTDREVIDSSWSYSLILSFKSKKEQDLYQQHPLHKDFIENASSLWTKVQVYDSIKL
ncbi:MAG: Dabb family protein [Bacteroides sp.]|nr:Dabb family protein [Bacteroides sp.]